MEPKKVKKSGLKTAAELGLKTVDITITHAPSGFPYQKGDKVRVTHTKWYNGEPYVRGYLNGSNAVKVDVPDVWTDVEYSENNKIN